MKSFVINVAPEVQRLQAFTSNYPAFLPPFEVVSCFTKETCSEPPEWWKNLRQYWAHLESMRKALRLGLATGEDFLFFEDDAVFAGEFEEKFSEALKNLPKHWDILYLGGCHLDSMMYPPYVENDFLLRGHAVHWNTGFLVNRKAAKKIVDFLEEEEWPCPHVADHMLTWKQRGGKLLSYATLPFIVAQAAGVSTMNGREYPERWGNRFHYIDLAGNLQYFEGRE